MLLLKPLEVKWMWIKSLTSTVPRKGAGQHEVAVARHMPRKCEDMCHGVLQN